MHCALALKGTDTKQGGLLKAQMKSNDRGMITLDGSSPLDKSC